MSIAGADQALEMAYAQLDPERRFADPERLFSIASLAAFATLERNDRPRYDWHLSQLQHGERSIIARRVRELVEARSQPNDAPREIDLAALASVEPQPPAFIIPERLPSGEVTLVAGHGGLGKTQVMGQLLVCLGTGRDFYGIPVEQREVDFVSFEDRADVLHWRLGRICAELGVPFADLVGKVRLFDGTESASAWYARGEYGSSGPTAAFHEIAQRIGGPGRVVIVDGVSDVFAGNENSRSEVKAFLRMLRTLIAPDGALVIVAHVDKLAAKQGADAQGYSGSSGWHNGVRCRWFMYAEEDEGNETGNVVLEVRKSNLGPSGARLVLRFDEALGVFQRVDAEPQRDRAFQRADESDAIIAAIREAWAANDPIPAAASGQRTAHSVSEARAGLPASLKGRAGRKRFYRALEELRACGAVRVESFRRPNRHVTEVLRARG